jgi:pimeloyl-ACP methyl ester carboxylesterase
VRVQDVVDALEIHPFMPSRWRKLARGGRLPGSELFLIPGAQHFVQLDEPEQVARLVLAMPLAN